MRGLNLIPNLIGGGFRINVGGLYINAIEMQHIHRDTAAV